MELKDPQTLFSSYESKAVKVAEDVGWKYAMTGTWAYNEDIRQQALIGLWEACTKFDPERQQLHKNNVKGQLDQSFWTVMLGDSVPDEPNNTTDPYATFWQWACMRVYGSVMDYLRKEGLITRLQGKNKDTKTMLYKKDRKSVV